MINFKGLVGYLNLLTIKNPWHITTHVAPRISSASNIDHEWERKKKKREWEEAMRSSSNDALWPSFTFGA